MDYTITALTKPEKIIGKYFRIKNQIIVVEDVSFQKRTEVYYQVRFLVDSYRTYATYKQIKGETVQNPYLPTTLLGTSIGIIDWNYPNIEKLKKRYDDMFDRCYNPKTQNYRIYGNFGITVNPLWFCFETYVNDLISMKGFHPALLCEENRIQLDKDYLQIDKEGKQDFEYGKYTCTWVLMELNSGFQKREPYKYLLENKNKGKRYFYNITEVEEYIKNKAPKALQEFELKKRKITKSSLNKKHKVGSYILTKIN